MLKWRRLVMVAHGGLKASFLACVRDANVHDGMATVGANERLPSICFRMRTPSPRAVIG